MGYQSVIDFWFHDIDPQCWWEKDDEFDRLISDRFLEAHRAGANCELYTWRETPLGKLAEVIVLDQFSRNIYRNQALAFSHDALALAQEAIAGGANQTLSATHKAFLYMPFMHSESKAIHKNAIQLFSEPELESNLAFELRHKAIIDRFGRYPHRNAALGRISTEEELAFLQEPGSSF